MFPNEENSPNESSESSTPSQENTPETTNEAPAQPSEPAPEETEPKLDDERSRQRSRNGGTGGTVDPGASEGGMGPG